MGTSSAVSAAYVSLLHTTLKCVGIAIILCVALSMTGGIAPMLEKMPDYFFTWDGKIGITTVIAWTIVSIGSIFSTQYIIQAVSSLKGPQDITRACWTTALLCLPVSFALGLIGVAAKFLFPNINSLYALPIFMNHMSPLLAGVVLTSFGPRSWSA